MTLRLTFCALGIVAFSAAANDALAVEALSTEELISHCVVYEEDPDGEDGDRDRRDDARRPVREEHPRDLTLGRQVGRPDPSRIIEQRHRPRRYPESIRAGR